MHKFAEKIARYMAITGGLVLTSIIILTCVSVSKRALGFSPILGDYELIEIGVAFAIMSFLPWCQLNRAHATVDILTDSMPKKVQLLLAAIWEVVFAVVLIVLSWRLFIGMEDKFAYGETTFLLQIPIWWGYAACFFASVIACLVGLWMVIERVQEFIDPTTNRGNGQGAVH